MTSSGVKHNSQPTLVVWDFEQHLIVGLLPSALPFASPGNWYPNFSPAKPLNPTKLAPHHCPTLTLLNPTKCTQENQWNK